MKSVHGGKFVLVCDRFFVKRNIIVSNLLDLSFCAYLRLCDRYTRITTCMLQIESGFQSEFFHLLRSNY